MTRRGSVSLPSSVGSDWPVSTLSTTPEAWFDVIMHAVAPPSTAQRDAVLQGTACSVYRVNEAG